MTTIRPKNDDPNQEPSCRATNHALQMNRRQFLFGAGAMMTFLSMPGFLRRGGMPAKVQAQVADYPRQLIGKLSELKIGEPVAFNYPWEHPQAANFGSSGICVELDKTANDNDNTPLNPPKSPLKRGVTASTPRMFGDLGVCRPFSTRIPEEPQFPAEIRSSCWRRRGTR